MSSEPNRRRLQCRGAESGMAPVAPESSAGERDFLRERLALFAQTTFIANLGFFLSGFLIEALWPPVQGTPATLGRLDILFHLAATAVLFLMWMATRQHSLSEAALRTTDAAGTIGTFVLFAFMTAHMPTSWRPEQLYMLIVFAISLYRAAIVPSPPARTAWISALVALPSPILASVLYARTTPPDVSRGQAVAYAVLWGMLVVLLSTLVAFVTFRLRKSVARARRLGQYTLGEKLGEGGMGVVYRAEHEMLRRPTAS